jgi:hypothetical protein
MTSARARFERELARSRYLCRFVVVIEGSLPDVLAARRQMTEASLIGTLAVWERRYAGFFFAGSIKTAAEFSFRFLAGQVAEIERAELMRRFPAEQHISPLRSRVGPCPVPQKPVARILTQKRGVITIQGEITNPTK